jgi:hypothetical protein
MSILEIIMLLCFGAAWPFSIYKSAKSRTVKGKSPVFLVIVLVGYIAGIANKIVWGVDYVIVFYVVNLIMVGTDLSLYFRNMVLDSRAKECECECAPEGLALTEKR